MFFRGGPSSGTARESGAGAPLRPGAWSRWSLLRLPAHRNRGLAVFWLLGGAAFILLVMAVFGEHGVFRIRQLGRDRANLEAKVAAIEQETGELRRRLELDRAGTGTSERAARERLGLVKPGEIVYDFRTDPLGTR